MTGTVAPGAPRSYSVGARDFDFAVARRLEIRLDGEVQAMVISYDVDAGELTRWPTDGNATRKTPRERETVHGRIDVRWKPAA